MAVLAVVTLTGQSEVNVVRQDCSGLELLSLWVNCGHLLAGSNKIRLFSFSVPTGQRLESMSLIKCAQSPPQYTTLNIHLSNRPNWHKSFNWSVDI